MSFAGLLLALGLLTACSDSTDVEEEASPAPQLAASGSGPSSASSSTVGTPSGPPLDAELRDLGLTVTDVRLLSAAATMYGYGLDKDTPLDWRQSQDTAYVMSMVCTDVASGEYTWQDAVWTDVSDGAPISDARNMNAYLRDQFCPSLRTTPPGAGAAGRSDEVRQQPAPKPSCPDPDDVLSAPSWTAPVNHEYARRTTVSVTATNPTEHRITVALRLDNRRPGQEWWDRGVAEVFYSEVDDSMSLPTLGQVEPFDLPPGETRVVSQHADWYPPPAADYFRVGAAVITGPCERTGYGDMDDYSP